MEASCAARVRDGRGVAWGRVETAGLGKCIGRSRSLCTVIRPGVMPSDVDMLMQQASKVRATRGNRREENRERADGREARGKGILGKPDGARREGSGRESSGTWRRGAMQWVMRGC